MRKGGTLLAITSMAFWEGVAFLSFATRLSYQYSEAFTFVETQSHLYLSLLATSL
jgi:hypothetical protein